jgi:hypothetical protein
MKRSVMIVALLSASPVFAQEDTNVDLPLRQEPAVQEEQPVVPEQPPPPELPPILVTPVYPPVTVIPAVEQIAELEESGHHKKTTGAVLQTVGGIVAFTGATMLVAASWSDDGSCSRYDDHTTWAVQSYTSPSSSTGSPAGTRTAPPPSCGDGTLAFAGGLTLLLGVAMILPGVAISQSGIGDLARAKQLRRTHGIEWSLRPSVGAHGGHAELAVRF